MPERPNKRPRDLQKTVVGKGYLVKTFHLPNGYEYHNPTELGSGSFGTVILTKRTQTRANGQRIDVEVAIKKFTTSAMANTRSAQLCYREVVLLKNLSHPNIARILDLYAVASHAAELDEIYLVLEYAGSTLDKILEESVKKNHAYVNIEKIPWVTRDILNALQYLKARDVIHRDLKPSNIAVNSTKAVLIDFGLSRTRDESNQLTNEAGTKCYWAPEISILKDGTYNLKVDIWSVGCILAELLIWRVLFEKEGKERIKRWVNLFGEIPKDFLDKVHINNQSAIKKAQDSMVDRVDPQKFFLDRNNVAAPDNVHHAKVFQSAVDLIGQCLNFDASSRITIDKALKHPFIEFADRPAYTLPDLSRLQPLRYDDSQRSIQDWKQTVFNEIKNFEERP